VLGNGITPRRDRNRGVRPRDDQNAIRAAGHADPDGSCRGGGDADSAGRMTRFSLLQDRSVVSRRGRGIVERGGEARIKAERASAHAFGNAPVQGEGFPDAGSRWLAGTTEGRGNGAAARAERAHRFQTIDTCAAGIRRPPPICIRPYDFAVRRPPLRTKVRRRQEQGDIIGGGPNRIGPGIELRDCAATAC